MNRIILLFFVVFFVGSASCQSVSTLFARQNAAILLDTDHVEVPKREKSKTENKVVTLLNQLFNSDESNKSMVLVINNESDCDFTMNIVGGKNYSIPVRAKKAESIVVEQGEYEMLSEVCKSPYKSHRKLQENTQLNIRYSIAKNTENADSKPKTP